MNEVPIKIRDRLLPIKFNQRTNDWSTLKIEIGRKIFDKTSKYIQNWFNQKLN